MNLVVNSSPMILLSNIGHAITIKRLADNIFIPTGVKEEIRAGRKDVAYSIVAEADWLTVVDVEIPDSVKFWDLGRGESEVIAYALSNQGVRPLLDDAEGKACALAHGLRPLGTAGFLIIAKRAGLIDAVNPWLCDLRTAGLWISDKVVGDILKIAGES